MSRVAIALSILVLTAFLVVTYPDWLGTPSVRAHGVVDQSQTQGNTMSANNSHPMMQSFRPTATTLVGVDVKVSHFFSSDAPGLLWTVAIRGGYPAGPIIALASKTGLNATATVVHVDFPQPVPLQPGEDYWLEVAAEGNLLLWARTTTGDPYPNGEPDAVVHSVEPNADRYFVTYSSPPTPAATATPRPTRTPRG